MAIRNNAVRGWLVCDCDAVYLLLCGADAAYWFVCSADAANRFVCPSGVASWLFVALMLCSGFWSFDSAYRLFLGGRWRLFVCCAAALWWLVCGADAVCGLAEGC